MFPTMVTFLKIWYLLVYLLKILCFVSQERHDQFYFESFDNVTCSLYEHNRPFSSIVPSIYK